MLGQVTMSAMSMSATLGDMVGVRRGGVRQRDAMSRGARSIRASRAPMVARKGRAGVQIRAAIESRPEHKKQASGSFDLDDVAAPGSTFSEMAATGKSAAPMDISPRATDPEIGFSCWAIRAAAMRYAPSPG